MQINTQPDLKYWRLLSSANTQVNIIPPQLPAGSGIVQFKSWVLMVTNVCFLRKCWACCLYFMLATSDLFVLDSEVRLCVGENQRADITPLTSHGWDRERARSIGQCCSFYNIINKYDEFWGCERLEMWVKRHADLTYCKTRQIQRS